MMLKNNLTVLISDIFLFALFFWHVFMLCLHAMQCESLSGCDKVFAVIYYRSPNVSMLYLLYSAAIAF